MNKPVRLQNAFISEGEVKKIVDFIVNNNEAEVPVEIMPAERGNDGVGLGGATSGGMSASGGSFGTDDEEIDDDMYQQARAAVQEAGKASTSYLQRKLRICYARAARMIDILEERGVIGPGDGAKPREVLDKGNGPATSTEPTEQNS